MAVKEGMSKYTCGLQVRLCDNRKNFHYRICTAIITTTIIVVIIIIIIIITVIIVITYYAAANLARFRS